MKMDKICVDAFCLVEQNIFPKESHAVTYFINRFLISYLKLERTRYIQLSFWGIRISISNPTPSDCDYKSLY